MDAQNAIKATSWGLYQVLGDHLLRAFPSSSDPVAAFYADPLDASNRMLVSWFHANPHAAAAARATPPDFSTLADIYNGSQVWGAHVAAALLRGDMGIVRASAVQVVTEHPVPVAIGVAMLAGGAAFAWWAYTKSKRVKRNRRSSRVRRNGSRPVRIEPRPDMQSKAYWVVSDGGATIGVVGELKDLGGWWAAPMVGYNRGYITRMSQKDAIDTVADEFETWERHGGVRKNRRSSRVRRNKIVAPVTLVAVGAGGEHALGTARGRAEFVKLVKQVTPTLAPGQRLEVRGAHRSLREIGVQANGQLQILTKDRWVQITAAF